MKRTKSQKIRNGIIFIIACAIYFFLCFLIGSKNQEEEQRIEENGIKGVCLITNKQTMGRVQDGGKKFYVHYEYMVNGEIQHGYQSFNSWDFYPFAFVGMRYEVKYLEDDPSKSIIYIDCPIDSEYENIEKVRDSLRATGKYKKGLENAESIETINAMHLMHP